MLLNQLLNLLTNRLFLGVHSFVPLANVLGRAGIAVDQAIHTLSQHGLNLAPHTVQIERHSHGRQLRKCSGFAGDIDRQIPNPFQIVVDLENSD